MGLIVAQWRADFGREWHAVSSRRHVVRHGDALQLGDGFELTIELAAQVFAFARIKLQRGQDRQAGEKNGADFVGQGASYFVTALYLTPGERVKNAVAGSGRPVLTLAAG